MLVPDSWAGDYIADMRGIKHQSEQMQEKLRGKLGHDAIWWDAVTISGAGEGNLKAGVRFSRCSYAWLLNVGRGV